MQQEKENRGVSDVTTEGVECERIGQDRIDAAGLPKWILARDTRPKSNAFKYDELVPRETQQRSRLRKKPPANGKITNTDMDADTQTADSV